MQVDYIVKIEVPTTTLKQDCADQYETVIGTGYPIRNGLVLTARHVVFPADRDVSKPIRLVWKYDDMPEPFHRAEVSSIVFDSESFDVAVLECDTGKLALPLHILADAGQFPVDGKRWKSHGYPTAGRERGVRIKNPACGTFQPANPSHYVQWLNSDGNVADDALWQGMSGAPVFDDDNRLVAVIIKTPAEYQDAQGNLQPEYEGRLLAASIPYLLQPSKCDGFRAVVWQSQASQLLPEIKIGDKFKTYLTKKITRELKKRDQDTPRLCEQLSEALEMEDDGREPNMLAKALVERKITNAIDALSTATADCVVSGGMRYKETDSIDEVTATAQQILGWLVLNSFDEKQLDNVLPHCIQHDSLFFTLAVKSLTGVEIVMARRFNRPSQFEHQSGPEQKSRHLISMPTGTLKWDEKESAKRIFIEVWNKVFPHRKLDNRHYEPKPEDWARLNDELAVRRDDDSRPEHYYIPFNASAYNHAELTAYVADVYRHFLSKLNQMTVIQYGEDGNDNNLFFIRETALQAAINKFYRRIHGE